MSIRLMAAAWDLDIPLTEKMVLLCLCDHANDNGDCWPSIDRVSRKCSVSDRTVQRAIRQLEVRGLVRFTSEPGKAHRFHLTPDTVSPPTESHPRHCVKTGVTVCHPTPDTVSPKPSYNHKEPSKREAAPAVVKPDGIPDGVWADFKSLRQRKRAPITETALNGMRREAAKAGWTLTDALSECVMRGWTGFKAEWVNKQAAQAAAEFTGPC